MVQVYACMLKTAVINILPPFRSRLHSRDFSAARFGRNSFNELFWSRLKGIPLRRLRTGPPKALLVNQNREIVCLSVESRQKGRLLRSP